MSELATIYVPLLGEGTNAWRPVSAERLVPDTFRVVGSQPDDETWMFAPGTEVRVERRKLSDGGECTVVLMRAT